ncbi:MAG: NTP transferase domain-containing protein [Verrucomicrobia bacterium]|nr:NTP transferase domain-containing protein [Verrucomicrobiota bacterium]
MNRALIQAGGKGTRLLPYTNVLPKPLLPVGDLSILEVVIRQLVHQGFDRITITVGHLAHLIRAVIGDGSQWGASIDYVVEDEPRGTIGAARQVPDLDGPFLVMNGDLLTDFNYRSFMEEHVRSDCMVSIGVYHKRVAISLGVFDLDAGGRITGFHEKPTYDFPCSMGIYAFDPRVLPRIPEKGFFGFDDLMRLCLAEGIPVRASVFNGLWLDIGRPDDYAQATAIFEQHRARLLPAASAPGCHCEARSAEAIQKPPPE